VQQAAGGGDAGVELLVLVKVSGVARHGHIYLPERGDGDLGQPCERAAPWSHLDVQRVARHERGDRGEHGDGRDAEPPPPPHVLLDVHHQGDGGQLGELDAEKVEVEEAPPPLPRAGLAVARPVELKLVGAERHDARPRAARADGRAEQRQAEDEQRPGGRAGAGLVRRRRGRAGRLAERREQRGDGEADHAELVDGRPRRDGAEAAGEGVGDEAADDRGEVGEAVEVGERVGGLDERQAQLPRQVRDQVGVEPDRREPVAEIVGCSARVSSSAPSMANVIDRNRDSQCVGWIG
jgi:hypothetical protein